jgi:capsular polysaccharide transport system permease protein
MTTKPKAKKFRIRRTSTSEQPTEAAVPAPKRIVRPQRPAPTERVEDGLGTVARRPERPAQPDANLGQNQEAQLTPQQGLAQIKAEGLTGRQLRMARRLAERHGLNAASDLDAVRLLRLQGVDPFQRGNMLELVVSDDAQKDAQLPATIQQSLPQTTNPVSEGQRVVEIMEIQRDLVRRRRRRMVLLLVRLVFFVALPTLIAGYYYSQVATPLYATKSDFVIQQSDSAAAGPMGGLFSGTGFATSQDSIVVQTYLQSRDAMSRLIDDLGFKAHFQQPFIDPIQKLPPDATNEAAFRIYKRHVKIGYDPTEGIIKLEVIAASPEASIAFSKALIAYAEEQVDSLSQRLRIDQMRGAISALDDAEGRLQESNRRVIEMQEKRGVVSAESELATRMGQIAQYEVELRNKRIELQDLLDNPRPNPTKVELTKRSIKRRQEEIRQLREELTKGSGDTASLARVQSELLIAQADVQTRQMMLSNAQQQLETARIEANRQVRYLSLGTRPVAPDEPTYPRKFENTLLAFLIFAGIYLMISLTASILREQVSA